MVDKKVWFVYMILAKNKKLYTGITTDPERRIKEHSSNKKGAKFFRGNAPTRIVYLEKKANRSEATKREIFLKKLTRKEKLQLVKEHKNL